MKRLFLFLVLLLVHPAALANMEVDRAVVTFDPGGSPRQDVTVFNRGDDRLFAEVEVLEVREPGTEDEERIVVRDPETIGLVASPRRVTVPANGRRMVRLVNLEGHGDEERVYRVNIRPVAGEMEAETMGVRILVGYQLLVFVPPAEARVELEAERDGSRLSLHNAGNVNIRLFDGRQCSAGEAGEDCDRVESTRLYPGNSREMTLPREGPVEFRVQADGQTRNRRFD